MKMSKVTSGSHLRMTSNSSQDDFMKGSSSFTSFTTIRELSEDLDVAAGGAF
jgi:hypothetical protein